MFLAFCLLATTSVWASSQGSTPSDTEQAPPVSQWRLFADDLQGNHLSEIIVARGNATLIQAKPGETVRDGDTANRNFIQADKARFYSANGWVYLEGNVRGHWDEYDMYAEKAEFDLNSQRGMLTNGVIFAKGPHILIEGERIEKTGKQTYTFENAELTACDGETPAWSIRVDSGDVTMDGYANLWHPRFRIKDFPVLYSPWASVPIKTKRESGLLFPEFGSSSRLGSFYSQPLYWAINDEQDATLYADYMDKRGTMGGVEYRIATDSATQGVWQMDWMHDKVVAPTLYSEDDQFTGDGLIRPNHNRYWLRGKFDGWLFDPKVQMKFDVDYASDQDYLRTFTLGHMDYENVRKNFLERFGRGLDVKDAKERTSTLLLTRSWDAAWSMNIKAEWTQNFEYMNGNLPGDTNPTVQTLPELTAYAYKQALWDTPFEFEADAGLGYFYRRHGNTGGRLEVHPRLSLPLASEYGTIIPTIGWRQTAWGMDYDDNPAGRSNDTTLTRGLPEINITGFSEIFRIYNLDYDRDRLRPIKANTGNGAWAGIRHAIQPRLEYNYVPFLDQEQYPNFGDTDTTDRPGRIEPLHEIRYSLINYLSRKRLSVAEVPGSDGLNMDQVSNYHEFFRLRLEQAFDIREAQRTEDRDKYERRPFGDLLAHVTITPLPYLAFNSRSYLSFYESGLTRQELSATLFSGGLGSVSGGYTYYKPIDEYTRTRTKELNTVDLRARLNLPFNVFMSGRYQIDIFEDVEVLKELILTYRHQCYDFSFRFADTRYDTTFSMWFTILGFSTPNVGF
jgi:LPS-assembly protein